VDLKKNHLSKQTKLQIEEEKYKPPTNRRLFNESNKCPNLYLQQARIINFSWDVFSAQIYVCQLPVASFADYFSTLCLTQTNLLYIISHQLQKGGIQQHPNICT